MRWWRPITSELGRLGSLFAIETEAVGRALTLDGRDCLKEEHREEERL